MFGKFGGVVIVILSAAIIAGLILRPSPDELPAAMNLGVVPDSASQLEPVLTPVSETTDAVSATEQAADATAETPSTEAAAVADEAKSDTVTTENKKVEEPATEAETTAAEEKAPEAETATSDAASSEEKPKQ